MYPPITLRRLALLGLAAAAVAGCSGGGRDAVEIPETFPPVGAVDGSDDEAVFQPGQVLTYTVTITEDEIDWIEEHGVDEEWQPTIRLVVSGGTGEDLVLEGVGFRHKGSASLQGCWTPAEDLDGDPDVVTEEELLTRRRRWEDPQCVRISYKLKFDKDLPYRGLRKLNLHANAQDPTKLHEILSYGLFYEFGLDAPRTAPARLGIRVVDGEGVLKELRDMGLFVAVEDPEERYPKQHYVGADAGNLFKEVWPNPALLAMGEGDEDAEHFDDYLAAALETNTKHPDVSDFVAFTTAVRDATPETFQAAMEPWVDLDEVLRYMAVDRAIRNWDGVTAFYAGCGDPGCTSPGPHNFFWYRDTGPSPRFHLVPWDLNATLERRDHHMDDARVPDWSVKPRSCDPVPVSSDKWVIPPGCDRFLSLLAATQWARYQEIGRELAHGLLRPGVIRGKAAKWAELIEPLVTEDPYADVAAWRRAKGRLVDDVLVHAAPSFRKKLEQGYVDETE